jgi:hypothetical protein
MMRFSYLCTHLAGTQPTKGNETGCPSCAKKHDTGDFVHLILKEKPRLQISRAVMRIS